MIYLNNSSTSWPKPLKVIEAVKATIENIPENYSRTGISFDGENPIYMTRKNLAKILGVNCPNNIAFTSGSTEALNTIIKGLKLQSSHVIISATEHNSVIRPLKKLANAGNIDLTIVPCDSTGIVDPDAYHKELRTNTRLLIINHVSNVTGAVQDVASIAKIAHNIGAKILVDASQSAGAIQVNSEHDDLDYVAFTGHKSLFGLQGIGGFYVKDPESIDTLIEGGTGIKSNILTQPGEMPLKFEAGTKNLPGIISLLAGTDFIIEETLEKIENRKEQLKNIIISGLNEIPKIKIFLPNQANSQAAISFLVSDTPPEEINYILRQSFDISIRSGLHCAPLIHEYLGTPFGTLRVSPSYFTTDEEVMKFLNAISQISEDFG